MSKTSCKCCGEKTCARPCMRCNSTACGQECATCGLPYCSEECIGADKEAHDELCGMLKDAALMHDGTYVGIDISTGHMDDIRHRVQLTVADFEGGKLDGGTIDAAAVLKKNVFLATDPKSGKTTKPPFPIEMYGAHMGEVGTGTRFFSKITGMIAPIHVEKVGDKVVVVLIDRAKQTKFQPKGSTSQATTDKYAGAIRHIFRNEMATRKLIELSGRKL